MNHSLVEKHMTNYYIIIILYTIKLDNNITFNKLNKKKFFFDKQFFKGKK